MTDAAEGMRKQLDAIWERSRKEIEGRVETIESAAIALLEGSLDPAGRAAALREAHKIAGVAGTFGFPQSTSIAREAELILGADHAITPADVLRLSAIANALRADLVERGRVSATDDAPAPDLSRAATRVVMVDDDPTVISLVTALLANHGIAVSGTTNPDDLWKALETQPPDVIMLDVDMPSVTGVELCRRIRADHRWDAVPIVFLTARTTAAIELFEAGADNYLTKPVNDAELLAVLRSRVRRTRSVRKSQEMRAIAELAPEVTRAPDVDVVIVDDDQVLVDLLCHAFTSRGYTTKSIGDGTTALQTLAGPAPQIRAKVIVLDVGLPEHDGLAVLRALSREGITKTTRVIMLTARSLESEVLQALDLGAFDHVAKPFSVPVLMHRIRRAIENQPGA
jgi:DNA-binding response OmpR family regulator/HPt (histidine-containing phosphotransfer) domain-containing protein